MLVIRPVQMADLDALFTMAQQTGYGMTTLPPDKDVLRRRIQESQWGFQLAPEKPRGETYLLVAEDSATGRCVGVGGILSRVGGFDPFYSYRLRTEPCVSEMLKVNQTVALLELVVMYDGPALVGSLFLLPEFRRNGNGRLLSLSRFLFMAQFPGRFQPHVLAEMRGQIDRDGRSPFWDAVGRHFFGLDFPQADYLTLADKRFIADLMPRYPLYVPLLPPAAQAAIGQVHPDTQPALKILKDEGFIFENLVDIFEAGAVYGASRDRIRAVRESRSAVVAALDAPTPSGPATHVISNTALDFRACQGSVIPAADGSIGLPQATAKALGVEPGAMVRYVAIRPSAAKL